MPVTQEDIANMAIGILEEAEIDSLDDDCKAARLCKRHFELTREVELQKHAWVFAIFRETVTGTDLDTGGGTLNWSYPVPEDALRVLPLTHNGEPDGVLLNWRREGDAIFSDQSGPRIIRYIANLVDPNDWSALFTDVYVGALAKKVAHPLTHKASMYERALAFYNEAVDAATTANAFERGGTMNTTGWDHARGDWRARGDTRRTI
ncbi:MAG: hypothetical protein JNK47_12725 [Mesorhizobium sp.]|nr:hypothetical protein [Mesorhizobium sp.]MBL8578084.1 hypothetical protein [Mesorhizobium sp.]